MWVKFLFGGVLVLIVGCVGVLGNCVLIRLFIKSEPKSNFHRLMITLAIYDTIYVTLWMIVFAVPELSESYKKEAHHLVFASKAAAVIQIALTGSVYCTVAISLELYLTVCHPFYVARKSWSAKRYIIPIVLFSLLYNISRFFEMNTKYIAIQDQNIQNTSMTDNQNNTKYDYRIELTSMSKNKYYYSIYIIGLNFFFNGLLPFALIITLNGLLFKRLKVIVDDASSEARSLSVTSPEENGFIRGNKRQVKLNEIELANVSIIVVVVFIVCHSIRWIPNIYELIIRIYSEEINVKWPVWAEYIAEINQFLIVFNSSVNFYIYYVTA